MKRVGLLNSYRLIMVFVHMFFTHWIIDIWGFKLKTFLFLTKINFFTNFLYFFYTGTVISYISYKVNDAETDKSIKPNFSQEELLNQELFSNTLFKFSFCLSIAVNVLYWGLYFFMPNMLGDAPTPLLLELFLHGGNMGVLLVDAILNKANRGRNLISTNFFIKFTTAYFLMQYFVYYTMNIEVYPLVSKLSFPHFTIVGVIGFGLFMTGRFLHDNMMTSV